jgi:HD-GYP domain-containing protein (c-di-GMP phosphodiesterase class II)
VGKREIFEEMARQISQGIYNQRLYRELKERQEELERAIREIGLSLVRAWESRYPDRRGHSERVSRYARKICEQMKLPEDRIGEIELAARLHDIGMVMMPDEIMFKKEVLTPAERAQIELHPTLGVDTLSPLPYFSGILPLIKYHHERYDGKGYPNGIKGETIPLGSRIISVADSYDAMTSPRLYRPPLSQAEVIEELKKGKAKQWDPEIVEAFLEVLSE